MYKVLHRVYFVISTGVVRLNYRSRKKCLHVLGELFYQAVPMYRFIVAGFILRHYK